MLASINSSSVLPKSGPKIMDDFHTWSASALPPSRHPAAPKLPNCRGGGGCKVRSIVRGRAGPLLGFGTTRRSRPKVGPKYYQFPPAHTPVVLPNHPETVQLLGGVQVSVTPSCWAVLGPCWALLGCAMPQGP
jgi:hypothetical protein